MSKFNNDVLHAREIQEQYNAHNKNTVEKLASFDPKSKCRYYNKVAVDSNAEIFRKKYIKTRADKNKPVNTKEPAKISKPPKPIPKPKKKAKPKLKEDSIISKVYALFLQGIKPREIAAEMDLNVRNVQAKITIRKRQNGLLPPKPTKKVASNLK